MIIDNRNESHKAKICTIRVSDRSRVFASLYAGKRAIVFRVKRQTREKKTKRRKKEVNEKNPRINGSFRYEAARRST